MNWWWGDVQHLGPIEGAPWHLLRIIGQLKKIFCKLHHKQMNESPLLKFCSLNIFRICSKRICCKQEADKVLIQVQPGAKSDYLLRRRLAISVTTDEHQLHEKFMTHYSSEELNRHKTETDLTKEELLCWRRIHGGKTRNHLPDHWAHDADAVGIPLHDSAHLAWRFPQRQGVLVNVEQISRPSAAAEGLILADDVWCVQESLEEGQQSLSRWSLIPQDYMEDQAWTLGSCNPENNSCSKGRTFLGSSKRTTL